MHKTEIFVGDVPLLPADNILSVRHMASCCGDRLSVGNVSAAEVSISLAGKYSLLDSVLTVTVDDEPLGTFLVTDCNATDYTTQLTGISAAFADMGGTYTPTVSGNVTALSVALDVASQLGVELSSAVEPIPISGDLSGHTCREMLGYIGQLTGTNCIVDRNNNLAFANFQRHGVITPDDYYADSLFVGGSTRITGVECRVSEDETLTVGTMEHGLTLENPYMTQDRLNYVFAENSGTYPIVSVSAVGGLAISPSDIVEVTAVDGTVYYVPAMSVTLEIDGGVRCTISSNGSSVTAAPPKSPTQNRIDRVENGLSAERTAREQAIAEFNKKLAEAGGLFSTVDVQEGGGSVYYLHDKKSLEESTLVIKTNAAGIGVSQDGGKTYPFSFNFVTGEAIAKTIYAGAAWIEQLFATEITAKNLHITGNSTYDGPIAANQLGTSDLTAITAKLGDFEVKPIQTGRAVAVRTQNCTIVRTSENLFGMVPTEDANEQYPAQVSVIFGVEFSSTLSQFVQPQLRYRLSRISDIEPSGWETAYKLKVYKLEEDGTHGELLSDSQESIRYVDENVTEVISVAPTYFSISGRARVEAILSVDSRYRLDNISFSFGDKLGEVDLSQAVIGTDDMLCINMEHGSGETPVDPDKPAVALSAGGMTVVDGEHISKVTPAAITEDGQALSEKYAAKSHTHSGLVKYKNVTFAESATVAANSYNRYEITGIPGPIVSVLPVFSGSGFAKLSVQVRNDYAYIYFSNNTGTATGNVKLGARIAYI